MLPPDDSNFSPSPLALLPASAAPATAPLAAPAMTAFSAFLAVFNIPFDERLRLFDTDFLPDADFLAERFFAVFFDADFLAVFLAAIWLFPLVYEDHMKQRSPNYEEALPAVDDALALPPGLLRNPAKTLLDP